MVFDHLLGHQLFLLIGGTEVVCQGENIIRIQLVEIWQTKHDKDRVISCQKLFTKGDAWKELFGSYFLLSMLRIMFLVLLAQKESIKILSIHWPSLVGSFGIGRFSRILKKRVPSWAFKRQIWCLSILYIYIHIDESYIHMYTCYLYMHIYIYILHCDFYWDSNFVICTTPSSHLWWRHLDIPKERPKVRSEPRGSKHSEPKKKGQRNRAQKLAEKQTYDLMIHRIIEEESKQTIIIQEMILEMAYAAMVNATQLE